MVYGKQTVWLATENSPRVSLYHATTGEFLMEIDLKPVVLQSLKHCDEIIKRHKEACLRVTCLTVCKDLLWVGTSAGIIVTVAIPQVSLASTQNNIEPPRFEVLRQGHIGHVRFLVSLESVSEAEKAKSSELSNSSLSSNPETGKIVQEQTYSSGKSTEKSRVSEREEGETSHQQSSSFGVDTDRKSQIKQVTFLSDSPFTGHPNYGDQTESVVTNASTTSSAEQNISSPVSSKINAFNTTSSQHQYQQQHRQYLLGVRRASVNPCTTIATQMKVISGGDGYEEFITCDSLQSENEQTLNSTLGNNDSLNHVLIWDVH
ncbi:hypothetical protein P879_06853 [Paragonimus westermani]|uniref:Rho guanine nucleotide exchange factor 17 n=1 Tax=Paragonimus westermani TaxID=34504 RepID=A0A8T0DG94_9TREM|nr:hypothetical protein P879_06853 [Paragonimus westermani]